MKVKVYPSSDQLGAAAAKHAAEVISASIAAQGEARLLLSTGASQFSFFEHFVKEEVDWSHVEMFHLDEYVGISPEHPASFQRYLRERFVDVVHPGKYHLIDGRCDPDETIAELTAALRKGAVDVGLIGIGENGHIAFNDPPADFDDENAYRVVRLVDSCLRQQIREGWFATRDEAYSHAISMTCREIMRCRTIISAVPYAVKAQAIYHTLTEEKSPMVPATLLREHPDATLYCDTDSAALLTPEILRALA